VAECDVVLVVIGPNWLGVKDESGGRRLDNPDDFVVIEIAAALARDIRVIPVLVDGARMPKASELPDSLKPLARRQAVGVRHAHFGHDAEALVARMREALGDDAAEPRRWRVRAAIGAVAVVLLLIGGASYAFIQHMLTTVEQTVQRREAELKSELERQAKAAAEAEAERKSEEAGQQRVTAVKAEQERQAKAAAEVEARAKGEQAERERQAAAQAEEERKAKAAAGVEANLGWLGVRIQKVTDGIADALNIKPPRGALVASFDDRGPLKVAGIKRGDVIVKFDGTEIKEPRDLARVVAKTLPGTEAPMVIIRKGKEETKTVTVGRLESQGNTPAK
jgi:PDZ domain-containing protein